MTKQRLDILAEKVGIILLYRLNPVKNAGIGQVFSIFHAIPQEQ